MSLLSDYYLIIILFSFSFLMIFISFYYLNKTKVIENNNEDKRNNKELYIFKIATFSIIFFASFDSSLDMKNHIDNKLLINAINKYEKEGFHLINNKNYYCQIPNSIIYLDHKGKEVTKDNYYKKMCI